jgi:hypothetical protein
MDPSMQFVGVPGVLVGLIVLGLPVLLFVGWYLGFRRSQKRLDAFAAWAATTGWLLLPEDDRLADCWNKSPFGLGDSRKAIEVLSGTWSGSPAQSFTYRYVTGSGKDRTTHRLHVVTMSLPAFLPTLTLTPEGAGAKLAKLVGGQDLSFESDDFNRAWRVECGMTKFAYDVITPRLMERLLRSDAAGVSIRIDGTDVLCWSNGEQSLEALAPRLGLLATVRDSVPAFVWREHGYDPGNG